MDRADSVAPAKPFQGFVIRYLGAYALLGEIGRGGMGVVYLGRQLGLNRRVALKLIHPSACTRPDARRQFRSEAEAMARLDHPGIVPIYEVGEHQGQPFIAMKLVEGESLASRLATARSRETAGGSPAGPSPSPRAFAPRAAACLLSRVARAVHHAHQCGVLHQDLKPSNILLDETDTPWVTDFGVARMLGDAPGLGGRAARGGTAAYAAPEQLATPPCEGTPAAEVYSLGVILHELLSGRRPEGSAPAALDGLLDPDLAAVCCRSLAPDPGSRYTSAADLADDLDRWLGHRPVSARVSPPAERVRKWARRNPAMAVWSCVLPLLALVVALVIAHQQRVSRRLLADARLSNLRWSDTVQSRRQREAELHFQRGRFHDGAAALAELVRGNPGDAVAAARLFAALNEVELPWPVLPPLRHDGEVVQGAFDPKRQYLLTAARDGWIRVWSPTSGVEQARFPHDAASGRFALSPDGRWLAALPSGGAMVVWGLPQGAMAWQARPPPLASDAGAKPAQRFSAVRFASQGEWLVAGDDGGVLSLWRTSDGALLGALRHGEPLSAVAFRPDAAMVAGVGGRAVQVWRIPQAAREPDPSAHPSWAADPCFVLRCAAPPLPVEFSPTRDLLLVAAGSAVEVWDLATGERLRRFDYNAPVVSAGFSPDGRRLIVANQSSRVYCPLVSETPPFETKVNLGTTPTLAAYDPTGTKAAAATTDGHIHLLAVGAKPGLTGIACRHPAAALGAVFSPDSRRLLTLGADGTARLWALNRPIQITRTLIPDDETVSAELSPARGWAAAVARDGTLRLAQATNAEAPVRRIALARPPAFLRFSPDGRWLAIGDAGGGRSLVDTDAAAPRPRTLRSSAGPAADEPGARPSSGSARPSDTRRRRSLTAEDAKTEAQAAPGAPAFPEPLAWSADGRVLAWAESSRIPVWSERDAWWQPMTTVPAAGARLLELSPDGRRLAVADDAPTLRLWRIDSNVVETARLELPGPPTHAQFSGDGRLLAAAGGGNAARVWDAASGQPLTPVLNPGADVTALALSPDGGTLVTGTSVGGLRTWSVRTGSALADFSRHARAVEFVQFSPDGAWILSLGREGRLHLDHAASGLPAWWPRRVADGCRVAFADGGTRINVSGRIDVGPATGAQRLVHPASALPPAGGLVGLTELVLGRRLTANGGWEELTETEWRARQQQIMETWTRLGPPPQVRVFR